jgi:plasmid stabilization system protein ParE
MDYIADRSGFDAAESFLDRINDKCQTLSKFPSMGRNRDESMENVRSLPMITSFSTVRSKQELKFCGLLAAIEI